MTGAAKRAVDRAVEWEGLCTELKRLSRMAVGELKRSAFRDGK